MRSTPIFGNANQAPQPHSKERQIDVHCARTRTIIGHHCWRTPTHQHTRTPTQEWAEFSAARQLYFDILRELWQFAFCQHFIQRAAVHFISKHVALKHTQLATLAHAHTHAHSNTRNRNTFNAHFLKEKLWRACTKSNALNAGRTEAALQTFVATKVLGQIK